MSLSFHEVLRDHVGSHTGPVIVYTDGDYLAVWIYTSRTVVIYFHESGYNFPQGGEPDTWKAVDVIGLGCDHDPTYHDARMAVLGWFNDQTDRYADTPTEFCF